MILNIDTSAVVKFTNTLEKLHKSALPSAVRGALNDAVFDVKTKTMLKSSTDEFVNRQKNFFKANSKFIKANGFKISTMQSEVGFFSNNLKGGNNYAVKDLEQQEHGGNIDGRSFIPMRAARVGGTGRVRPNARIADIKNTLLNAAKVRSVTGRHKKQRFIRAAIKAKELQPNNAFMLGNKTGDSQTLFRVDELHTATRHQGNFGSRKLFIKLTPLYRVKKNRVVSVKKRDFMKRASLSTVLKIESFYIKQAQRQIAKFIK